MSKLHECEVHRLHPTQITVGMIEVADKRAQLRELHKDQLRDFLAAHPIPAVEGPAGKLYITDHHHLGRALTEQRIDSGFFLVEADFSHMEIEAFWIAMDQHKWVHPYDEQGAQTSFSAIPNHLERLKDDPYRSLAGYVRNAGGYQKTSQPFIEFLWADFFRKRIVMAAGLDGFYKAVQQGIQLAHSSDAKGLPGFVGP